MTQNREGKNASACQRDTNRKQISFTQQNFREAFGLDVPFTTEERVEMSILKMSARTS